MESESVAAPLPCTFSLSIQPLEGRLGLNSSCGFWHGDHRCPGEHVEAAGYMTGRIWLNLTHQGG